MTSTSTMRLDIDIRTGGRYAYGTGGVTHDELLCMRAHTTGPVPWHANGRRAPWQKLWPAMHMVGAMDTGDRPRTGIRCRRQ